MSDSLDGRSFFYNDSVALGMRGVLWKWTNYINGWQKRYFILHQGVLSYFKSEEEMKFGCRGAISLKNSKIVQQNDFDPLRFDVVAKDCIWYLKAETCDIDKWISALTDPKAESGYDSESSFPLCCSNSLASERISQHTTDSNSAGRMLRKKLNEIATLEELLFHQISTLQTYFDACANSVTREFEPYSKEYENLKLVDDLEKPTCDFIYEGSMKYKKEHGEMAIDFKGEAISFKSTALGMLCNLRHCVEIISQIESSAKHERNFQTSCVSKDEEYFDAMDSANINAEHARSNADESNAVAKPCDSSIGSQKHSVFTEEMDKAVQSHIKNDRLALSDLWHCIHQEGSMFVYRKEVVENGTILDPLKMVHSVEGITGFELCWYFWNPKYRMDWETTLESSRVLEHVDNKTVISYQVHKRVWPTAQRDSCLLSRIDSVDENKQFPTWIVVNRTVEHPDAPVVSPKIRILVDVALTCETKLKPSANIHKIAREDLICDLTYVASVHPGGWAPIAAVRAVAKREFPRFLHQFTNFVIKSTKNISIRFN